jgi:hypothetical protein
MPKRIFYFMKKASTSNRAAKKFELGEHIRVVPLYHPKPSVAIDDLARARQEWDEQDLFDGKAHAVPASAHLSYQGGPLIQKVQVFTVYWGKLWNSTSSSQKMMADLNKFFTDILVSPLLDQLSEYNVPGQVIGQGSFLGTKVISANSPAGSIADSAIQAQLLSWIQANTVPQNSKNTLYFIYLDPGIVSIMGGGKSCQNYCGYHNNAGEVYYALMPYPTCSGCLGGMNAFDALTGTSSHELCEAITDPVPGSGWYDQVNGEIGDICAWNFKKVAGYTVQLEWSNTQNKCA